MEMANSMSRINWDKITKRIRAIVPHNNRNKTMVRNRFQRLTSKAQGKNICRACGKIKRGHICKPNSDVISKSDKLSDNVTKSAQHPPPADTAIHTPLYTFVDTVMDASMNITQDTVIEKNFDMPFEMAFATAFATPVVPDCTTDHTDYTDYTDHTDNYTSLYTKCVVSSVANE